MVTVETTLIIIIVIITVFFGFGFLIWYAFKFEVTNFQIINNIVYLKPNKNKTSLIKILHLSDFHLRNDYKGQKLAGFIKILSLDSYDFIFITGDLSEKNELHDRLIQTLEPLKARYGIYAVFGAHDYYNKKPTEFIKNMFKKRESYSRKNDVAGLRRKLESIGIKVLQNESVILNDIAGYHEIDIIGVDDPIINKMDLKKSLLGVFKNDKQIKMVDISYDKNDYGKSENFTKNDNSEGMQKNSIEIENKDMADAEFMPEDERITKKENQYLINASKIKKTSEYKETFSLSDKKYHILNDENKLRIALVHTPDSYGIVNLSLNAADVIFAGHTHGGQVRLPKIGALISGCSIKTRYAAGLFYFKNFVLQVSKGLGEGRFSRFRINCDPEAIITEIRCQKDL